MGFKNKEKWKFEKLYYNIINENPRIFKNNNKIIKNDKAEVLNIISFILRNFHAKISEK